MKDETFYSLIEQSARLLQKTNLARLEALDDFDEADDEEDA